MINLHQVEQGTDEWHQLRAGKYTGGSADKVLKFGTIPYSQAKDQGFRGNFWTKRGHILEEEAIELYERITKTHVDRPGFVTNTKFPSAGYSPDGLGDDFLIEVKCFDEVEHMKLIRGNIKLSVLAQIYFGLLITEKPVAYLLAYNPALDPDKYTVKDQFKIITVKRRPTVAANFRRILRKKEVLHATN